MTFEHRKRRSVLFSLMCSFVVLWLALAIEPLDRSTWLLENVLLLPASAILVATWRVAPLSLGSCVTLFLFFSLHAVGAHFTYSLVPYDEAFRNLSGQSLSGMLGFTRNHYDRLVHLAYGLLIFPPIREMFMLHAKVRGFWSYFLPLDFIMSTSAIYELLEWASAIAFGGDVGAAFLGTQGDEWDAQRDMGLAGLGSVIAIVITLALNLRRRGDGPPPSNQGFSAP